MLGAVHDGDGRGVPLVDEIAEEILQVDPEFLGQLEQAREILGTEAELSPSARVSSSMPVISSSRVSAMPSRVIAPAAGGSERPGGHWGSIRDLRVAPP
jgi:hypothetical protein